MRRCSGYRKPRENVRNVFLHKIFKDRYKMESIAAPVKKVKTWSYNSIRYKPKKYPPKRIREISIDDIESDLYEDALEEFYEPYKSHVEPSSIMIKLKSKDGMYAEIRDPEYKSIDFTKEQLAGNNLELVFDPIEPKLAVLLGGKPIYVTKNTKGHGDYLNCVKTDVGIQTSLLLPNNDPFETDLCTTQQNVNSLLIETTGKQISFDELPYDYTLNCLNPDSVKFKGIDNELHTENSHQNIANKFRDKSFTNLVNTGYDNYYCSHTTSLVSSLPSDEIFPSRKFIMKRSIPQDLKHKPKNSHTMVSTLYVNDKIMSFPDVSDVYLPEITRKTNGKINYKDEEELKTLSEPTGLCLMENSEDSSFELIIDNIQDVEEAKNEVPLTNISTSVSLETKSTEDFKNDGSLAPHNSLNDDNSNIEETSSNLPKDGVFQDLKSNEVPEETIQESFIIESDDIIKNDYENIEGNIKRYFSSEFTEKSRLQRSPSEPDIIAKMERHSQLFSSDVNDEDVEVYIKEMESIEFFGDERPPTPMDPTECILGKCDVKSESERNIIKTETPPVPKSRSSSIYESKCSLLKDPLENSRPQTSSRSGSRERPMTSVSQALKGVETALKPLQDQLKEIRTKMASLNNQFYTEYTEEIPNVTKKEKTFFPIKEKEVLPTKFVIDKNRPKPTLTSREVETEKFTKPSLTRHDAISIWTEPEDIIGDSSHSMNLSMIGVKTKF